MAQWHLDRGQRVWLLTAAPVEIAQVIARRLGRTGALGTVAEHGDGVYTGRLVGEMLHGESKAVAVRALAESEGLDLDRCYAYSDSSNDIPMLSLVGNPCAVNPDGTLRSHARENDWLVRDYRTGRKAVAFGVKAGLVGALATLAWLVGRRLLRRRSSATGGRRRSGGAPGRSSPSVDSGGSSLWASGESAGSSIAT